MPTTLAPVNKGYATYNDTELDVGDVSLTGRVLNFTSNGVVSQSPTGDYIAPQGCLDDCDNDTTCQAVVYDFVTGNCTRKKTAKNPMYAPPSGSSKKALYIKPNVASWTPQPGLTDANGRLLRFQDTAVNPTVFDYMMIPNNNIKILQNVGVDDCRDAALRRPDAMGFQYNKRNASCAIKAKFPAGTRAQYNQDSSMHVKKKDSPWNTNRAYNANNNKKLKTANKGPNGWDYINAQPYILDEGTGGILGNTTSSYACKALCDAMQGCDTFELTPDNSQPVGQRAMCRLITGGSGFGAGAMETATGTRIQQYTGPTDPPAPLTSSPSQQYCNLVSGSLISQTSIAASTFASTSLPTTSSTGMSK